jgi:ribonuclease-3
VDKLCAALSYEFKDLELLKRALRHCSAGKDNNERLEFLGDSVLGLIIAEILYNTFPNATEGELSRLRANLVQQSTLAEIAREVGLGSYLILGAGEIKSGGANRESILADALEALICALYLDGGFDVCSRLVRGWFAPRLSSIEQMQPAKDAKTRLQEFLQARKLPLPVYAIVEVKGKDHQQKFLISCSVVLLKEPETGFGTSRKEAEQKAASAVLQKIGNSYV